MTKYKALNVVGQEIGTVDMSDDMSVASIEIECIQCSEMITEVGEYRELGDGSWGMDAWCKHCGLPFYVFLGDPIH